MNIYEKIQKCRVELQRCNLKKTGKNSFSNYDYFELGDFLPKINELFAENKLCSIISFDKELATLMIIDSEKPDSSIAITSPMAEASLKGCHPIQNMGAIQTYQRRYLYMSALEIVEHDAIDGLTGKKEENLSEESRILCEDCQSEIVATTKSTKEEVIAKSQKYHQKNLCAKCLGVRYRASQQAS